MITLGLYWMFSFLYLIRLSVKWYNEDAEYMQKNFRYYYVLFVILVLVFLLCMIALPIHLAEVEYERDRDAKK